MSRPVDAQGKAPTDAGSGEQDPVSPTQSGSPGPSSALAKVGELASRRPELILAAAFVGGIVLAAVVRRRAG